MVKQNNLPAKATEKKQENPLVALKSQIAERAQEFAFALPAHMPAERFNRVILTAVQNNPALIDADRQSFFNSCMKAAQDGLLPDGREGALVIFNGKIKRKNDRGLDVEQSVQLVQWMPMIFGILKKIRNSGQLKSIVARVVYEGDQFRYWIDNEGEHLEYEAADNPNPDVIRRVFAMAQTLDGGNYVEVMTVDEIEKVRAVSRAGKAGPWAQWWDQMACKTVLRRLSKRLPMSSDLDDLIRRDDGLYDLKTVGGEAAPRLRGAAALDALAARPGTAMLAGPSGGGDVIDEQSGPEDQGGDGSGLPGDRPPSRQAAPPRQNNRGSSRQETSGDAGQDESGEDAGSDDGDGDGDDAAEIMALIEEIGETPEGIDTSSVDQVYGFRQGMIAADNGLKRTAVPGPLRKEGREAEAAAWQLGHDLATQRSEG